MGDVDLLDSQNEIHLFPPSKDVDLKRKIQ